MPVDTSIYNAISAPPKSALEYQNEFLGAQANRQKIQQNAIGLQSAQASLADAQRVRDEQAGIRNALATLPPTSTPDDQVKALRALGTPTALTTADTLATSYGNQVKAAAGAAKDNADAGKTSFETQLAKSNKAINDISAFQNPQDVMSSLQKHLAAGDINEDQARAVMGSLPQTADPAAFKAWRLQTLAKALDSKDQLAALKPITGTRNTGSTLENTNTDPLTGIPTVVASTKLSATPGEVLQANTSRANNRDTIAKDLTVAGIGADGAPTADVAATVKAIGEGRMAPPTLQALRNPRMASIMNQVNQQYPNFDATVYATRQKAMKDFGTGPQGQQVQAANTALNHLDTLEQLAKAQANGNIPLFNQLANKFAAETGSAVPTNLQGAITLVGPEISKAVVGAGGGQGDREKVDAALTAITKGSPDQQAGQIATMKDIFGGRLSEVGRTYQRATHLDNFGDMLSPSAQAIYAAKHGPGAKTAPAAGAGAVPPDIQAILDRHGKK